MDHRLFDPNIFDPVVFDTDYWVGWAHNYVQFLNLELNLSALTKDDDESPAKLYVMVGDPPHIEAKDLFVFMGIDCLVTIDYLRATSKRLIQDVPLIEDARYVLRTWTIAKQGIDGIKLKQKLDNEVKRVFRLGLENHRIEPWEASNRLIGEVWIYLTTFIIALKIY